MDRNDEIIKKLIKEGGIESPSASFTDNVMHSLGIESVNERLFPNYIDEHPWIYIAGSIFIMILSLVSLQFIFGINLLHLLKFPEITINKPVFDITWPSFSMNYISAVLAIFILLAGEVFFGRIKVKSK